MRKGSDKSGGTINRNNTVLDRYQRAPRCSYKVKTMKIVRLECIAWSLVMGLSSSTGQTRSNLEYWISDIMWAAWGTNKSPIG